MSPAELLFGRRLRSRLDLLKPDLYKRVEREQERQKEAHDRHSQDRSLLVGDAVYVRNFGRGPTWLAGQIIEQPGPRKYRIRLTGDGIVWCRHKDHVRRRYVLPDSHCEPVPLPVAVPIPSVPNSDDSGSLPQVAEGTSLQPPLQKTKNLDLVLIQPHQRLLLLIQKWLIPMLSQPDVILREFVDPLIVIPVTDTSIF